MEDGRQDRFAYLSLQELYTFRIVLAMLRAIYSRFFDSSTQASNLACSRVQTKNHQFSWVIFYLCPWQESNLHQSLRRALFYPLNYKGRIAIKLNSTIIEYHTCNTSRPVASFAVVLGSIELQGQYG